MNDKPLKSELIALAKIRVGNVSDWTIQLAHLIGTEEWDEAAVVATNQMQALNILAGIIAQLLPIIPSKPSKEFKTEQKNQT